MKYHLLHKHSTLEMGTMAAIDATLIVGFTHEPADPRVGCPAEITIEEVLVAIGEEAFDCDTYNADEIKTLCWVHVESELAKEAE